MFFEIVQNNIVNKKIFNSSFYKIRLNNDLIDEYKEILNKGNNLYIDGYLHSYKKDSKLIYYIYPKKIELIDKESNLKNSVSLIDYDNDGVMLWNGKKCIEVEPTSEEKEEMEKLLDEFN